MLKLVGHYTMQQLPSCQGFRTPISNIATLKRCVYGFVCLRLRHTHSPTHLSMHEPPEFPSSIICWGQAFPIHFMYVSCMSNPTFRSLPRGLYVTNMHLIQDLAYSQFYNKALLNGDLWFAYLCSCWCAFKAKLAMLCYHIFRGC